MDHDAALAGHVVTAPPGPSPSPVDRTTATLRIRTATADDATLLADLGARTFTAAYTTIDAGTMTDHVAQAFTPERIRAELSEDGATFLLAYDDASATSRAVAYAHLRLGAGPQVAARRPVELVRLYVEPSAIGQGYGTMLLRSCLDHAARQECDAMWLGVWEHNDGATRLYGRLGFRVVGAQQFALGQQLQTDLVMVRPVSIV
jgi:ribosomal protein S18 acetylase RimI-like enzyme